MQLPEEHYLENWSFHNHWRSYWRWAWIPQQIGWVPYADDDCIGATLLQFFPSLSYKKQSRPDCFQCCGRHWFCRRRRDLKGDNRVNGITTAAMIWLLLHWVWLSVPVIRLLLWSPVVLILVCYIFYKIERLIDKMSQIRIIKSFVIIKMKRCKRFELSFKENNLHYKRSRQMKAGDVITGEWIVKGSEKNHRHLYITY